MRNIFCTLFLVVSTTLCFSQSISEDVWDVLQTTEKVSCILELKDQWQAPKSLYQLEKKDKARIVFQSLKQHAEISQSQIISYLEAQKIDYKSYYIFNGLLVTVSRSQLSEIIDNFDIESIALDEWTHLDLPRSSDISTRTTEWGIKKIQADELWSTGIKGEGAVIAGQDTGYDFEHVLISKKYRGYQNQGHNHNYNWYDAITEISPLHEEVDPQSSNNPCGLDIDTPCDDHGHGTHTMGTMVGGNDTTMIGVAPQASWIGCRSMERGWGKPSTYSDCFQFFLAPTNENNQLARPDLAPDVINNSWGCPTAEGCNPDNWQFMENIINNLVSSGIMVVVSAGNDGRQGCSTINRPASMFENSFVVGASAQNDEIAEFSSIGPVTVDGSNRVKPDVVAPGVDVKSITLSGFGIWSGTSMAGPHVAGTVALMISANPEIAGYVQDIEKILRETAEPLTMGDINCDGFDAEASPNIVFGHGRINAMEAVYAAQNWIKPESFGGTLDLDNIKIYPNPASTVVTIDLQNAEAIETVFSIYDNLGRVVMQGAFDGRLCMINVEGFTAGMYHLVIIDSDHRFQRKIVMSTF